MKPTRFVRFCTKLCLYSSLAQRISDNLRLLKSLDAVSPEKRKVRLCYRHQRAGQCPNYVQSQCEMNMLKHPFSV